MDYERECYIKVMRVIKTCQDISQLKSARRLVNNYSRVFGRNRCYFSLMGEVSNERSFLLNNCI